MPEVFRPRAYSLTVGNDQNLPAAPPPPPVEHADDTRKAVRSLLRWGGHKPSGRGRPASESLLKASLDGRWPQIHPLVDQANLISLQSGLPISVLDQDKLSSDLELRIGGDEESYVFNPSGQLLKLKGLLLIADGNGPVGSPVKDCQKTKIGDGTRNFFFLVWGTSELPRAVASVDSQVQDWCSLNGVKLVAWEIPSGTEVMGS